MGTYFSLSRCGCKLALVTMCTAFLACAEVPEDSLEAPAADALDARDDSQIEGIEQAIRAGVTGGGFGTVELEGPSGQCSGALVGRHMILTAAHCFSDLGGGTAGTVQRRVQLSRNNGTSWTCLTGAPQSSSGKCSEDRNVWAVRLGTGAQPAERDVALVFPFFGGPWSNITSTADGLFSGPLNVSQSFVFFGRGYQHFNGTGSGTMRFMTGSVDWVGAGHFIDDAEGVRVCRGDSGGPYFLGGGNHWIFGIASSGNLSNHCAEVGEKTRGPRLIQSTIDWINTQRGFEGLGHCTRHSSSFPDFWVCG